MISQDRILAVIESRFDHHSSRVVLAEAVKRAGFSANKHQFDGEELKALVAAFAAVTQRADSVVAALNALVAAQQAKAKAREPEPEPEPPAEAPQAEEPADEAPADKGKKKKK